ncbi:UNKNOWN [Stylonychia lemnae]|uniref:Uncharacterized protein n=1 Tax=Stylonychia lemnae TaxID=5949 RepID=A0A077ZSD2_STYLE|nr:UNKNOWN [Stylonychia lemnae]|eukprot:CDW72270.1 UNKNOWN [Stylonychia lemnae]
MINELKIELNKKEFELALQNIAKKNTTSYQNALNRSCITTHGDANQMIDPNMFQRDHSMFNSQIGMVNTGYGLQQSFQVPLLGKFHSQNSNSLNYQNQSSNKHSQCKCGNHSQKNHHKSQQPQSHKCKKRRTHTCSKHKNSDYPISNQVSSVKQSLHQTPMSNFSQNMLSCNKQECRQFQSQQRGINLQNSFNQNVSITNLHHQQSENKENIAVFQSLNTQQNNKNNANLNDSSYFSNPNLPSSNIQSQNKDITTVKAFKYQKKYDKDLSLQNQSFNASYVNDSKSLIPGSRSTTVKKECFNNCNSQKNQCQCRSQCEKNLNISFTSHNCYNQEQKQGDQEGQYHHHRSKDQRKSSSIMSTPIINMEKKFMEQQINMTSQNIGKNECQSWNEYQDQPRLIVSCSPLSSLLQSQIDRKSNRNKINDYPLNNIQVIIPDEPYRPLNQNQEILQQYCQNSVQSKEEENSLTKLQAKHNYLRESLQGSNNINISKLSDNMLNSNSVVSKHSINSSNNGGLGNLIHLSCNSNSNFFLHPRALIEQKQGMFASAELTQGLDGGSNSNYFFEDHQKSNSSIPMFSPLKESDLFQSKKITPRTYYNHQAQQIINNISQNSFKTNQDSESQQSLKQSFMRNQVSKIQNAIQNLQPFDLKSPSQMAQIQSQKNFKDYNDNVYQLQLAKNYSQSYINEQNQARNQLIDQSLGIGQQNPNFQTSNSSSSLKSLNFTLTESNITQHPNNQNSNYLHPRSRQDTHRVTATFLQVNNEQY